MNILVKILATGFGSGYFPRIPGTAGSLAAAMVTYYLPVEVWQLVLFCLAGVYICGQAEKILGCHDSPHIVFDEFCGMFIAAWGLRSPGLVLAAFVLFRFFDMAKPLFINRLQELPGGWGVMADDIAAGAAARLILALVLPLLPFS